jgi:hypothetical protein
MPFTNDGPRYADLLDTLRQNHSSWASAQTLAECQAAAGGISGVDADTLSALVGELSSQYMGAEHAMLEQLRLSALAWPAVDYGLTGPEWQGYFVTETADGQQFYATDRCALTQEWTGMEISAESLALTYDEQTGLLYDEENWYLPDGKTKLTLDAADPATSTDADGNVYVRGVLQDGMGTVANLRDAHFDTGTRRWRRWSDDGAQFEYYNNQDGTWERRPPGNQAGITAGEPDAVEAATFTTAEEAREGAALVTGLIQRILDQVVTALPGEVAEALSPQDLEYLAVAAVKTAVAGQT